MSYECRSKKGRLRMRRKQGELAIDPRLDAVKILMPREVDTLKSTPQSVTSMK